MQGMYNGNTLMANGSRQESTSSIPKTAIDKDGVNEKPVKECAITLISLPKGITIGGSSITGGS